MKNGVPWEIARMMDPTRRLAYVVYFGMLAGMTWDWNAMDWEPPRG